MAKCRTEAPALGVVSVRTGQGSKCSPLSDNSHMWGKLVTWQAAKHLQEKFDKYPRTLLRDHRKKKQVATEDAWGQTWSNDISRCDYERHKKEESHHA